MRAYSSIGGGGGGESLVKNGGAEPLPEVARGLKPLRSVTLHAYNLFIYLFIYFCLIYGSKQDTKTVVRIGYL